MGASNENFRIVKTEEVDPGSCPGKPDFPSKYRYTIEFADDEDGVQRTVYSDGKGEFKRGRDDWSTYAWDKLIAFLKEQEKQGAGA